MKLLVVGAGEMGRWVADTVEADVAFCDADSAVAADAAAARQARRVPPATDESFDVVCLAVPMSAIPEAVETYAPCATAAMFDVSGVMADPLAAMADHASSLERASFHRNRTIGRRWPGRFGMVPIEFDAVPLRIR